jgi:hypothetical protein
MTFLLQGRELAGSFCFNVGERNSRSLVRGGQHYDATPEGMVGGFVSCKRGQIDTFFDFIGRDGL